MPRSKKTAPAVEEATPTYWEQAAVAYWHAIDGIANAFQILSNNGEDEVVRHAITLMEALNEVIPMACPKDQRDHISEVIDNLYRAEHGPTPEDQRREFEAFLEQLMSQGALGGQETPEPVALGLGD